MTFLRGIVASGPRVYIIILKTIHSMGSNDSNDISWLFLYPSF